MSRLKTATCIAMAYVGYIDVSHAAGVDAAFLLPLPFIFGVLFWGVVLSQIKKNAMSGRWFTVGGIAVVYMIFGILLFKLLLSVKNRYGGYVYDPLAVIMLYPVISAFCMFFSYSLARHARTNRTFTYFMVATTLGVVMIVMLIFHDAFTF